MEVEVEVDLKASIVNLAGETAEKTSATATEASANDNVDTGNLALEASEEKVNIVAEVLVEHNSLTESLKVCQDDKSATHSDDKSATHSDVKSATHSDDKSATHSDDKSATHSDEKSATHSDDKSAAHSGDKSAAHSDDKSATATHSDDNVGLQVSSNLCGKDASDNTNLSRNSPSCQPVSASKSKHDYYEVISPDGSIGDDEEEEDVENVIKKEPCSFDELPFVPKFEFSNYLNRTHCENRPHYGVLRVNKSFPSQIPQPDINFSVPPPNFVIDVTKPPPFFISPQNASVQNFNISNNVNAIPKTESVVTISNKQIQSKPQGSSATKSLRNPPEPPKTKDPVVDWLDENGDPVPGAFDFVRPDEEEPEEEEDDNTKVEYVFSVKEKKIIPVNSDVRDGVVNSGFLIGQNVLHKNVSGNLGKYVGNKLDPIAGNAVNTLDENEEKRLYEASKSGAEYKAALQAVAASTSAKDSASNTTGNFPGRDYVNKNRFMPFRRNRFTDIKKEDFQSGENAQDKSQAEVQLESQAINEILKEVQRGAARAREVGALGWQQCTAPVTNKTFLRNTLVSTLREPYRRPNKRGVFHGGLQRPPPHDPPFQQQVPVRYDKERSSSRSSRSRSQSSSGSYTSSSSSRSRSRSRSHSRSGSSYSDDSRSRSRRRRRHRTRRKGQNPFYEEAWTAYAAQFGGFPWFGPETMPMMYGPESWPVDPYAASMFYEEPHAWMEYEAYYGPPNFPPRGRGRGFRGRGRGDRGWMHGGYQRGFREFPDQFPGSPRRFSRSPRRFSRSPRRFSRSPRRFSRSPGRVSGSPQGFSRSPQGFSRSRSRSELSRSLSKERSHSRYRSRSQSLYDGVRNKDHHESAEKLSQKGEKSRVESGGKDKKKKKKKKRKKSKKTKKLSKGKDKDSGTEKDKTDIKSSEIELSKGQENNEEGVETGDMKDKEKKLHGKKKKNKHSKNSDFSKKGHTKDDSVESDKNDKVSRDRDDQAFSQSAELTKVKYDRNCKNIEARKHGGQETNEKEKNEDDSDSDKGEFIDKDKKDRRLDEDSRKESIDCRSRSQSKDKKRDLSENRESGKVSNNQQERDKDRRSNSARRDSAEPVLNKEKFNKILNSKFKKDDGLDVGIMDKRMKDSRAERAQVNRSYEKNRSDGGNLLQRYGDKFEQRNSSKERSEDKEHCEIKKDDRKYVSEKKSSSLARERDRFEKVDVQYNEISRDAGFERHDSRGKIDKTGRDKKEGPFEWYESRSSGESYRRDVEVFDARTKIKGNCVKGVGKQDVERSNQRRDRAHRNQSGEESGQEGESKPQGESHRRDVEVFDARTKIKGNCVKGVGKQVVERSNPRRDSAHRNQSGEESGQEGESKPQGERRIISVKRIHVRKRPRSSSAESEVRLKDGSEIKQARPISPGSESVHKRSKGDRVDHCKEAEGVSGGKRWEPSQKHEINVRTEKTGSRKDPDDFMPARRKSVEVDSLRQKTVGIAQQDFNESRKKIASGSEDLKKIKSNKKRSRPLPSGEQTSSVMKTDRQGQDYESSVEQAEDKREQTKHSSDTDEPKAAKKMKKKKSKKVKSKEVPVSELDAGECPVTE